jgi:hypothetical protein
MSNTFEWPEPDRIGAIADDKDHGRARLCYLLDLALVYSGMKSYDFAMALGNSRHTIYNLKKVGTISPEMAIRLETMLGRKHFPRELFRPDMFVISGE